MKHRPVANDENGAEGEVRNMHQLGDADRRKGCRLVSGYSGNPRHQPCGRIAASLGDNARVRGILRFRIVGQSV